MFRVSFRESIFPGEVVKGKSLRKEEKRSTRSTTDPGTQSELGSGRNEKRV